MSSDDALLRTLVVIVAVILLVPLLGMVVMMPMMGLWGGGHVWSDGPMNGAGWLWLLLWLVPLAIVLGLGYLVYQTVRRPLNRETDPAIEEVRRAYARGELTDEEFEQRRERLRRER